MDDEADADKEDAYEAAAAAATAEAAADDDAGPGVGGCLTAAEPVARIFSYCRLNLPLCLRFNSDRIVARTSVTDTLVSHSAEMVSAADSARSVF